MISPRAIWKPDVFPKELRYEDLSHCPFLKSSQGHKLQACRFHPRSDIGRLNQPKPTSPTWKYHHFFGKKILQLKCPRSMDPTTSQLELPRHGAEALDSELLAGLLHRLPEGKTNTSPVLGLKGVGSNMLGLSKVTICFFKVPMGFWTPAICDLTMSHWYQKFILEAKNLKLQLEKGL